MAPPATDCNIFNITVVDRVLPLCDQNNGSLTVRVTGGVAPYLLTFDKGEGPTDLIADSLFVISDVGAGTINYTVVDDTGNGANSCGPLNASLETSTSVTAQIDTTSFVDANCGELFGRAVVNATGLATGDYFYSADNGLNWTQFTPGNSINDLPPIGSYNLLIGASEFDSCPDTVSVTIDLIAQSPLQAEVSDTTISLPTQPTGSLKVVNITGGNPPYLAALDLVNPAIPGQNLFVDFDTVGVNPNTLQPEITYEGLFGGVYEIEIRDINGCSLILNASIATDNNLFVPNIFTPNNDGVNEVFFIRNLPSAAARLRINNRWGKTVFQSDNYQNDWDGGDSPDGIYYYVLVIPNGPDEVSTGWVEILRGAAP